MALWPMDTSVVTDNTPMITPSMVRKRAHPVVPDGGKSHADGFAKTRHAPASLPAPPHPRPENPPSRIAMRRCASRATPESWVMSRIVMPCACSSCSIFD
jgi:hypothetical protein